MSKILETKKNKKTTVLMVSQSNYPHDPRVRQEALKLLDNGYRIITIAQKYAGQKAFENVNGVLVYRIPMIELFNKSKNRINFKVKILNKFLGLIFSILGYGFEFFYFTFSSLLLSIRINLKYKFHVLHVHNPPDTLVILGVFWKIFRKKFVFDHHDLSPDLYLEKFGSGKNLVYKILLFLEKTSCKLADRVIATNNSYKQIEEERCSVDSKKIYIVRNGPDLNQVKKAEPISDLRKKSNTILCYLGSINKQDGVDNILEVLNAIINVNKYKDIHLLVLGGGDYLEYIKKLAKDYHLESYTTFTDWVLDSDLLNRYLSSADIFIDAAYKSFLNDNSTFIKHMEYMVFAKPIISFDLEESVYSLKDAGVIIESNDIGKMSDEIINLISDNTRKKQLGDNALKRVKELSWDVVSLPLLDLYNDITKTK